MIGRQYKHRPLGHQSRNTLGSAQQPNFDFQAPYPLDSSTFEFGKAQVLTKPTASSHGFRVPSPTKSEEEEIEALENSLPRYNSNTSEATGIDIVGSHTEKLSQIGDSSSLFGTPSSAAFTFRFHTPSSDMVVEREPPKAPLSPRKPNQQPPLPPMIQPQQQPEFGKASPLQNRLKTDHVFNIPKSHKAHPEWHLPQKPAIQNPDRYKPGYVMTEGYHDTSSYPLSQASKPTYSLQANGDVVEIPRPTNLAPGATYPKPPPVFSSRPTTGFATVNQYTTPSNVVDLTTEPALLDDRFGAPGLYDYIDAGKATENIKALLEGAFEDEEDKPRTRRRKKKAEAAMENLTDKLQELKVKAEGGKDGESKSDDEEEDEEDDGKVEGLKVRLLPHQVDGVEWMRDKETGKKKTRGVLPKGGILADDVGLMQLHLRWRLTWHRWVWARPFSQSHLS